MAVIINADTSDGLKLTSDTSGLLQFQNNGTVLGMVQQVVSTTKTDAFSTTSTSMTDITGLSVSITPSSTSNKILVTGMVVGSHSADKLSYYNLVRGSTNICTSTGASSLNLTVFQDTEAFSDFDRALLHMPINFLDSPSTTASTTYKMQIQTPEGTVFVNRRGLNSAVGATSTITVMEIAG